MRLIDGDKLSKAVTGTSMPQEQRTLFMALIAEQPLCGVADSEFNEAMHEMEYWRDKCEQYQSTILKLAVKLMEREGV